MRNAVDFSWGRPDPTEIAAAQLDALIYVGNARPSRDYVEALRAAGVGVCMIHESDPNRSQQGAGAGAEDARFADAQADGVGYPESCSMAYVVSDGNRSDPRTGADQITAYAKAVVGTSRRPVFWYGNQYACDAAMVAGGLGTWIPSTWGDATLLTQEANVASPIPATDLNTVHAPYGNWSDTPAPVPVKPLFKECDLLIRRTSDDHREAVSGYEVASFRSLAQMDPVLFVALDADEWDVYHAQLAAAKAAAETQPGTYVLAGKVARVSGRLTGTATP